MMSAVNETGILGKVGVRIYCQSRASREDWGRRAWLQLLRCAPYTSTRPQFRSGVGKTLVEINTAKCRRGIDYDGAKAVRRKKIKTALMKSTQKQGSEGTRDETQVTERG